MAVIKKRRNQKNKTKEKGMVTFKRVHLKIKIKVDYLSLEKIERRKSSALNAKDRGTHQKRVPKCTEFKLEKMGTGRP